MSIFTSLVSETLPVPGGSAHTVTIRKLAPKHLAEARKVAQQAAVADMQQMRAALGAAFDDALKAADTSGAASAAKAVDPLLAYDRVTLMQHGVTAWTLAQPLGREAFEDLDDDAQDWLAGAILRLSKPSLYQTPEQQAEAQGNG